MAKIRPIDFIEIFSLLPFCFVLYFDHDPTKQEGRIVWLSTARIDNSKEVPV
jgi:hypothetical protein